MCRQEMHAGLLAYPKGTLHRRAIDATFIKDNGCTDPCNLVNIHSIIRNQNKLVLLKRSKALIWNGTLSGPKYQKAERLMTAENKAFNIDFYFLPFNLVQGFIVALFGRLDSQEIRDAIYIDLFIRCPKSNRATCYYGNQRSLCQNTRSARLSHRFCCGYISRAAVHHHYRGARVLGEDAAA